MSVVTNKIIRSKAKVNFGYVLWVAFSIPPGSLSLVKYPAYLKANCFLSLILILLSDYKLEYGGIGVISAKNSFQKLQSSKSTHRHKKRLIMISLINDLEIIFVLIFLYYS
jgi:hypothetical protein